MHHNRLVRCTGCKRKPLDIEGKHRDCNAQADHDDENAGEKYEQVFTDHEGAFPCVFILSLPRTTQFALWGPDMHLSPCRHAPPTREKVVNRDEDKPDVCAVKKALDQPKTEASKGEPLEGRQSHLQKRRHVMEARWHDQS